MGEGELGWFEPVPAVSLQLLEASGLRPGSCLVDVGGGNSRLVDELVTRGLGCLAVLDVSHEVVERSRARLGSLASVPMWIEADVTGDWSAPAMDIWHDRAAFHFLADETDRERYRAHLRETLKPGGAAIIATFAMDGPPMCSGLPVRRYSPETLAAEFDGVLELADSVTHKHMTPSGMPLPFQYCRFTRVS
jgi:hypothetical protein